MTHKLKELHSALNLAISMRDAEAISELREEISLYENKENMQTK